MTEKELGSDAQFKAIPSHDVDIELPLDMEIASHDVEEDKLMKVNQSDYVDNEPKETQYPSEPPDPEADPNPANPLPPPEGESRE